MDQFEKLSEGDRVLFNDRKTPLKVEKIEEDRLLVQGPHGGEYEIYVAEETDDLLVSRKDNRRYASYCKNLRNVGKWSREQNTWIHSKSGAQIKLEKNSIGYWTVKSSKIDISSIELPKYGYSDIEIAETDVEKFIKKHPEG